MNMYIYMICKIFIFWSKMCIYIYVNAFISNI